MFFVLSSCVKYCTDLLDLSNVSYEVLDACNVPADKHNLHDLILLVDVFHDVPYPAQLLNGVHRLLKQGGKLIMLEIDMLDSIEQNKKDRSKHSDFICLWCMSIVCVYCICMSMVYVYSVCLLYVSIVCVKVLVVNCCILT